MREPTHDNKQNGIYRGMKEVLHYVAKTKALISFAVFAQSAPFFSQMQTTGAHDVAHLLLLSYLLVISKLGTVRLQSVLQVITLFFHDATIRVLDAIDAG